MNAELIAEFKKLSEQVKSMRDDLDVIVDDIEQANNDVLASIADEEREIKEIKEAHTKHKASIAERIGKLEIKRDGINSSVAICEGLVSVIEKVTADAVSGTDVKNALDDYENEGGMDEEDKKRIFAKCGIKQDDEAVSPAHEGANTG